MIQDLYALIRLAVLLRETDFNINRNGLPGLLFKMKISKKYAKNYAFVFFCFRCFFDVP